RGDPMTNDRHDQPTPADPLEARLRGHLDRTASTVAVSEDPRSIDLGLEAVRSDADGPGARTRQRRLGALSLVSVAASVAVVAAVIGAQGPQPVRSELDPAARIAGVATGSST